MNINQLPDLCFSQIFSEFTLVEQYKLSTVCKHWKIVIGLCVFTLKLQISLPFDAGPSDLEKLLRAGPSRDAEQSVNAELLNIEQEIPVASEPVLSDSDSDMESYTDTESDSEDETDNEADDNVEANESESENEDNEQVVEYFNLFDPNSTMALRKSNFESIFGELLINSDGTLVHLDTSQRDTIKLTGYDMNSMKRIAETFHRINNLEVFVKCDLDQEFDLASLVKLQESYTTNLNSLKLCICTQVRYDSKLEISVHQMSRLCKTINRMFQLRHLTLDISAQWFNFDPVQPDSRPQLELPIIGRLCEFNFASFDKTFILRDSFKKYSSSNLLKIGYCCENMPAKIDELCRELPAQLCARFHMLDTPDYLWSQFPRPFSMFHCSTIHFADTKLSPFADLFTSLTTLSIEINEGTSQDRVPLYDTFARLVSLRQLTVLHIRGMCFPKIQLAFRPLPQLTSVKVLTVNLGFFPHKLLSRFQVSWTFPNVQVVSLNRAGPFCHCGTKTECEINFCLLVKDSQLACPHLRALYYNERQVSIERLLLVAPQMEAAGE